jgi:hypothetical protein
MLICVIGTPASYPNCAKVRRRSCEASSGIPIFTPYLRRTALARAGATEADVSAIGVGTIPGAAGRADTELIAVLRAAPQHVLTALFMFGYRPLRDISAHIPGSIRADALQVFIHRGRSTNFDFSGVAVFPDEGISIS